MIGDPTGTDSARIAGAAALRADAVRENNAGRPMKAARMLRRALALLGGDLEHAPMGAGRVLAARVLLSLAVSESELVGLDRGRAALAEVQEYVDRTGDPSVAVLLHLQRGFMTVRGGRLHEGLAELNAAVELIDQAEPAAQCNIMINRGMVSLLLGDLRSARADYRRAIGLAEQHGLAVEERKARHNLGEVEFFAGNLADALRIMDEAADLRADVSFAVALLDRSKVLLEAGLHREADEALKQAGDLFAADRLWRDVGEVELARAQCALLAGEFAAARRLAGRARTRFRRRGNDRWRRDAELMLLQADLEAGRPGSRLAPPALRLAAEFRVAGLLGKTRTAQLIAAEALLGAGRVEQALRAATEAGQLRSGDPVAARLQTRLVRARLLRATGRIAAARRQVRDGLVDLAAHQARFGGIDLQTAGAVYGRDLAELDLTMALEQGTPAAAFTAIERGRATSSRLKPVQAPRDEIAAGLLSELRQLVDQLREDASDPQAVARVGATRDRAVEIQSALRSRSWHQQGSGDSARPARFGEIQDAVRTDGAALISLFDVRGRLHAVIARGRQPMLIELGPAAPVAELARKVRVDLDVLADGRLPRVMVDAVRASLHRSLSALEAALISPLHLDESRLVIVPSGALATVPWASMPALKGCPIEVAPSATAWLAARAERSRVPARTVHAFAGPELSRSIEEAHAVSRLWKGALAFTGASAGQESFVGALGSANLVHVAAHGQHQAENPLFSSIRLADGPVFAYELDQNARAAEHVVLSACELGQATIRPGDEALGLTSVLLHLGTRCVVAGVARVHDDVAADVMVRYHAALAAGADSATALAQACAAEDERPAPFVCFGAAITF